MKKRIPFNISKAINEFLVKANNMFGDRAKKIILYGSYARGDFNKSSDIDIMILHYFLIQCRKQNPISFRYILLFHHLSYLCLDE